MAGNDLGAPSVRDESRVGRGWRIARGAWRLSGRERALISVGALWAVSLVGWVLADGIMREDLTGSSDGSVFSAPLLIPIAYLFLAALLFLTTALAAAASAALDANPMSAREALAEAADRIRAIAGLAVIVTVVDLAIGELTSGSPALIWLGLLATLAWMLAIYFVSAAIAIDGLDGESALRHSARLAGRHWREILGGTLLFFVYGFLAGFAFGIVFAVCWVTLPVGWSIFAGAAFAVVFARIWLAGNVFAASLYRFATERGQGPGALANVTDPPRVNAPGRLWITGRIALGLVALVAVLLAAAPFLPDRQHHDWSQESIAADAREGRFYTGYPETYPVDVPVGAPVVYRDRQVGVICDSWTEDEYVVLAFEADPSLAPLVLGNQMSFERGPGGLYLQLGTAAGAVPPV